MREVKVGGTYRHFKGNIYKVICVALDSEDKHKVVVYTDGKHNWVRDYEMFLSKVEKDKYPDVKEEFRFTEVE